LDEDYVSFPDNALLDLNIWVHHKPHILKQGRVNWYDVNQSKKVIFDFLNITGSSITIPLVHRKKIMKLKMRKKRMMKKSY
jgi:hypothetical protein